MEPRMLRDAADLVEAGVPFAVAVVVHATGSVPGKEGATMLVLADGTTRGTVGGAGLEERVRALARDALARGRGGVHRFDLAAWKEGALDSLCGGSVDVAIHVVSPGPNLFLVGAGHCSQALAAIADACGWRYSVVDSRAAYATRDRFPNARDVHHAIPAAFVESADLSVFTHVTVMGHSHHEDADTLVTLLRVGFAGPIGVIGSRAKKLGLFERARERGVSEEALARVRIPIGLAIGAERPGEIAVAIAAEIIQDTKGMEARSSRTNRARSASSVSE